MSDKPLLLLPGPLSAEAASSFFGQTYEYDTWLSHEWTDENATVSANGKLRPLAGRRIDFWDCPMKAVDSAPVLRELFHLGCTLRIVSATPDEPQLEPRTAKQLNKTPTELLKWAREHVQPLQQPPEIKLPPIHDFHTDDSDDDAWPMPIDLWEDKPVPRLNPSCLPGPLADFVKEQSLLTGVDPTVIGLSCLVACAGVIHDGFRVQPKAHETGWTESARLWGVVIGDPASKKSPGIEKAISPLKKIDHRLGLAHKDVRREYDEERQAWERKRGEDKGPPPPRPPEPRVLASDTTVEALADVMIDNPQGILVYRDELAGWFGSMDAYSAKGNSKDRAFWLEAYNGGSKRIDRVGRGHMYVENCSACLLGGIQPAVFASKVRNVEEDGLLQRFMVVVAGAAAEDEDRPANEQLLNDYALLIEDLHRMRPAMGLEVFKLSEEAQMVRKVWIAAIRKMVTDRAVPHAMISYLGKWEGLYARLLLTFHMVNYVGNGNLPAATIDENTAMRVCEFMERTLLPHALEFYDNVLSTNESRRQIQWIAGYILSQRCLEIANRDIQRYFKEYQRLQPREKNQLWATLEESGWVRQAPGSRVGKASQVISRWEVNPAVHDHFGEHARRELLTRQATKALIQMSAEERRHERK